MELTALFELNYQLSVLVFQNILKLNDRTHFYVSGNYKYVLKILLILLIKLCHSICFSQR